MNKKVIVVLLLVAIVLSVVSIMISFNFDSDQEEGSYSQGNSASVGLVVEETPINSGQGEPGE